MNEINFSSNSIDYTLTEIRGKVVDKEKMATDEIHRSGGNYDHNTGRTTPVSITRTTHIHDKIYLIDKQGKEHDISLTDWDLSYRIDHELRVLILNSSKNNNVNYVAIKNISLDKVFTNDALIDTLSARKKGCLLVIVWGIIGILIFFTAFNQWKNFGNFPLTNIITYFAVIIFLFIVQSLVEKSREKKIFTEINSLLARD